MPKPEPKLEPKPEPKPEPLKFDKNPPINNDNQIILDAVKRQAKAVRSSKSDNSNESSVDFNGGYLRKYLKYKSKYLKMKNK